MTCRSVRQTPQASTRTEISDGPGVATSRSTAVTLRAPGRGNTIARMEFFRDRDSKLRSRYSLETEAPWPQRIGSADARNALDRTIARRTELWDPVLSQAHGHG